MVGAGWDACPASWWIEIAATLTAAGLTWPRPACLQDMRFWDGQVRAGFRKAIPSRRQLARRWHWTDWKVRDLLRTEDWKERRTSAPPKNLPTASQNPPSFEEISQVQTFHASQPPPNHLPTSSTRAHLTGTQITGTQITDTQDRPAGVSLEEVGSGRDGLSVNKSQKVTPAKQKTRCLTRQQAAALPIPDGLPAGYADAFTTWCEVRPGSTWRQSPAQIERTHRKLLQAYSEGKDVVQGLERAIEGGWKGIKTSWLEELPRASRPAVKDTDQRIPTWATRRRIQRPEPNPEPQQANETPAPWEV